MTGVMMRTMTMATAQLRIERSKRPCFDVACYREGARHDHFTAAMARGVDWASRRLRQDNRLNSDPSPFPFPSSGADGLTLRSPPSAPPVCDPIHRHHPITPTPNTLLALLIIFIYEYIAFHRLTYFDLYLFVFARRQQHQLPHTHAIALVEPYLRVQSWHICLGHTSMKQSSPLPSQNHT